MGQSLEVTKLDISESVLQYPIIHVEFFRNLHLPVYVYAGLQPHLGFNDHWSPFGLGPLVVSNYRSVPEELLSHHIETL